MRLSRRPALVRRAASWAITSYPPTSLDDVVAAVGLRSSAAPDHDRALRRLVTIAGTDDLAGRVVIERLKPGLLKLVRRHDRQPDAFEELLAAAWIAIRTFNPDRRPSSIAAALLSDAEWSAYRRSARRQSRAPSTIELVDAVPATRDVDPLVELAELLGEARRAGFPSTDLDLVRRLAADQRTEDIARDLAVSARTVRNRRARVTKRLREMTLAA